MGQMYFVGEPIFQPGNPEDKKFWIPAGQADLARQVLSETQDLKEVTQRLREEYLAIIFTLMQMDIPFRVVYSHPDRVDMRVLGVLCNALKCRLVGFLPDYSAPAVVYPRDFATVLPGIVLLSDKAIAQIKSQEKDGWQLRISPFGEGGRVLSSGKKMLVCEKVVPEEGRSVSSHEEVERIRKLGMEVGILPSPLHVSLTAGGEEITYATNDHLDRVGCLIKGKDGKPYLVVDPQIITADWRSKDQVPPWLIREVRDSLSLIQRACEPLEIEVRWPRQLEVPYSLNLVQFLDGRVLMTGEDESAAKTISDLVGSKNLFRTPAPIRYHPVWARAGIHCLVSEMPTPIMKVAAQTIQTAQV